MNPLQRALIEKAGNDHGFEYVMPSGDKCVELASARHLAQVRITPETNRFLLSFTSPSGNLLNAELVRTFPDFSRKAGDLIAPNQDALVRLIRRAAELARVLPNQAADEFDASLKRELEHLPNELRGTEVERLVRQRIGQQSFRNAMLEYWRGACALTGISLPELLRASHAKPWANCESVFERLDVFNGFLLSANLDALFDRFLISFNETGAIMVSPRISPDVQAQLGLNQPLQLRWLAPEHQPYMNYHRERFGANT